MIAPWERPGGAGSFSLQESARRLGAAIWVEQRLFETIGRWTTGVAEPVALAKLGVGAARHAWHAEVLVECLPKLQDPDPQSWIQPGHPDVVRLLEAVAGAPGLPERLAGVYRVVVPRKIAAYTLLRNRSAEVTDGPTIRALGHVLADEIEEWRDGELTVQSLIGSGDDAERVARHQAALERLMVSAGGILGAGSLEVP